MSGVWETLRAQRAVRTFDQRPIPAEVLERIVDAGRLSPSSKNSQRWAFITCTDAALLQQLSKIGDYADHLAGATAAIALLTPTVEEDWRASSIAFDLGQASQSMMLVAWEEGVGSVHAAVYDQPLTRSLLGYPDDWRCEYILSLGYPKDPSIMERGKSSAARKPSAETVHRGRW